MRLRSSVDNKENAVPMTANSGSISGSHNTTNDTNSSSYHRHRRNGAATTNNNNNNRSTASSSSLLLGSSQHHHHHSLGGQHPFAHGAIVRIQFTNFLTYDHVTVKPGPHINVVIGPNGTGKSSIICGICLAVGGSPKVLGRSELIGDFVKHGKREGSVDLFLWDSRRKRERCLSVHIKMPNSAAYFVDNQPVKVTELRDRVKEYNIQVDNPCTFLAQDKVKSFAQQGPQILLKNTEKAGPTELTQLHDELLEQATEGKELQEKFDRGTKRMEQLEMELKTKKARVDSYKEWSDRNKVIALLRLRKALMEYEDQLEEQRRQLGQLDEIVAQLKRVEGEEKKRKKAAEKVTRTIDELSTELDQMKPKHRQTANATRELKSDMDSLKDDELNDAAQQLNRIRRQHADFEQRKEHIKKEYQRFRTAYERAKMDYKPNPVLAQLKEQLARDRPKLEQGGKDIIERQNAQQTARNRFTAQKDAFRELLDTKLNSIVRLTGNPGILNAWNAYQRNKDQFRGPVYVPYLHMRVPDSANLVFLNNLFGVRDMGIFVFCCKEDEERLLRGNNPHRIHATIIDQRCIDQAQQVKATHELMPTTLGSLGFTTFASTLFEAPDPVFAYLCLIFNLDRVLIGSPAVEANYEHIAHQLPKGYSLFLTPNYRVDVTCSRFNTQQRYTRRSALARSARLNAEHTKVHQFFINFDAMEEELRQRQTELDQLIKRYSGDKQLFEQRMEMFKRSGSDDQDKRNHIEGLQRQMGRMEADLEEMAHGKPNLAEAETEYGKRKSEIAANLIDKFDQYVTILEGQRPLCVKCALAEDELRRLKKRKRAVCNDDDDIGQRLIDIKRRYQAQARSREEAKINVEEAKSNFKKLTKYSPADNEQTDEERRTFRQMKTDFVHHKIPDNANALDERMGNEVSKASKGRQEGTEKDVHEYQRLLEEHDKLGTEVRRVGERNDRWKSTMDERLKEWLDPLGELVANISVNFTKFFAQLGCAGEVRLDTPADNKYNVADYGLSILVKFRHGTALRVLDPHTQSGGERSVATMLYLLALQNLCPVPFRCMDEINQGMDPDNERAVFNMMVRLLANTAAPGEGQQRQQQHIAKTQYFLLTPKLLNGLEFNERVTVHIVHNGPEIEHGEHWDPERFFAASNGHHHRHEIGGQPRQFVRRVVAAVEEEEVAEDD